MPLPDLTFRERILYKDTATAYRPLNPNDGTNNIKGWTIARIGGQDITLLKNFPCNFHSTPNFDSVKPMGQLTKIVNLETSNVLTCQSAITLVPKWIIHVVTRHGREYWQNVDGAAEDEVLVDCTCVYITPGKKPVTII
jgi:hypothetical protein